QKNHLFRRTFKYSIEYNADISLVITLRHNRQIFFFNLNSLWSPLYKQLVCYFAGVKK
ncbi:hypothetical protein P170DRAFT_360084, partial [Aspergillus steynii IBT 23096]